MEQYSNNQHIHNKIPNWTNSRGVLEITKIFIDQDKGDTNIFSDFIESIQNKKTEKYLAKNNDSIKILDIGSGQGNLLEDLINYFKIKGIGISKYPEWELNTESKNNNMNGEYIHIEIKDRLPEKIEDNSIDFITSFFSLQYMTDAPKVLQDIYRKLKPGGEALVSLGIVANISFRLIENIIKNNDCIENHIVNGIQIFKIKKSFKDGELFMPKYTNNDQYVDKEERPEEYHNAYDKWFINQDGKRGDNYITKQHDLKGEKAHSFKRIQD